MGFFDTLGKKATEAYNVTTKKTGELAKEAKLRMKINENKSNINDLYKEIGKKVYEKHHTLEQFFETVLGITKSEASENACKIEHIISQNVLNEMRSFTKFCQTNKEILDTYKKEKSK